MLNRMTFIYAITLVILISLASFVYNKVHPQTLIVPINQSTGVGWARYTSTQLGLSVEYPSDELSPLSDDIIATTTIKIDNTKNNTKVPVSNKIKEISAGLYPNIPAHISSVDQFLDPTGMGIAKSLLHAQDIEVGGEKAVLYTGDDSPNDPVLSYKQTTILFFHNKQMWYIHMINIPSDEENRVWKSFKFLNK